MKIPPVAYLLLALIISAGVNVYFGWQLAQASVECQLQMVEAAKIAIENERKRADKADRQAAGIAQTTKADTGQNVATEQGKSNDREQGIRTVRVHGDCRMPVGLPSLQPAIDAANAAARD